MQPLELRESDLGVRSLRLVHASPAMRAATQRWLEPIEREAIADPKRSLSCEAGIVDAQLVSIRCVRFHEWEPDPTGEPGMQGGSTEPERVARTWQIDGDDLRVMDEMFVDEDGTVERCRSEATCTPFEPSPAFAAFVRRLLH